MPNSEKILRILQMVSLINRKQGASLADLCEGCGGVCERTVYRNLEALNQSGWPVMFDAASHTYRFTCKIFLQPLSFTVNEAAALLVSIRDLAQKDTLLRMPLQMAQHKIMECLPYERRSKVDAVCRHVEVQLPARTASVSPKLFERINQAIEQQRQLKIDYYSKSRDARSKRIVDPYVVTLRGNCWYMLAYCHSRQEVLLFRIDRIKNIEDIAMSFTRPADFSSEEYFRGSWGVEHGAPVHIKLRFSASAARWVREMAFPEQVLTACPDGTLIYEATVNGQREISSWIMGYGAAVEVLVPEDLRAYVASQARAAAALYAPDAKCQADAGICR